MRSFSVRLVDRSAIKAKVNLEGGDRWNHTIDPAVVKHLSNIPIVLSANLEKL
jgi:hypothetical protein